MTQEQKDQLQLIILSDPSLLLRHLEEDTSYNANLVGRMIELAKERASELIKNEEGTSDQDLVYLLSYKLAILIKDVMEGTPNKYRAKLARGLLAQHGLIEKFEFTI